MALICRYIYNPRSVNYEKLYAVATFLAPLQSNLLSEPEKKIAREYFKTEVKKLEENDVAARENYNTQGDEGGEDQEDTDQEDAEANIPGATLLAKLNTRDLQRLDNDAEFHTRFGSLHKSIKH